MRFSSTIVSSFLFACAFLSNLVSSDMLAKSIYEMNRDGALHSIRATFHAPLSFGPSSSGADFGIFIDDPYKSGASLLASVSFGHSDDNEPFWTAWYQWVGGGPLEGIADFPISVGEEIALTITTHSSTSATVIFDNISQGHRFSKRLSSSNGLRLAEAAWFIAAGDNGVFPNFATMNVTSAMAIAAPDHTLYANGGNLYPMESNGKALIYVSPDGFCDTCLIFQQVS